RNSAQSTKRNHWPTRTVVSTGARSTLTIGSAADVSPIPHPGVTLSQALPGTLRRRIQSYQREVTKHLFCLTSARSRVIILVVLYPCSNVVDIETVEAIALAKQWTQRDYEEELKDLEDSLCETDSDKRAYLMRKLGSNWIVDNSKGVPDYVSAEVQLRRGRELPTFTFVYLLFRRLYSKSICKIEKLAKWLLGEVQSQVTKTLEKLADDCFKAFQGCCYLRSSSQAIDQVRCRADLAKLISHERRLFTQDSQFSEKLRGINITSRLKRPIKRGANSPGNQSLPAAGLSAHRGHGANVRAVPHARQRCHQAGCRHDRLFAGGSDQVDILDLLREKEGRQRRRRYLTQAACQMRESRKELQSAKQNRMLLED
uniref:Death domain-containing protein n=1 Tax=Macrostomum lignano TaxID=282301 RepID=A0A1I8F7X3_9PLAT